MTCLWRRMCCPGMLSRRLLGSWTPQIADMRGTVHTKQRTAADWRSMRWAAELVAANRAGSIAAGLTPFVVLAVGFLVASGLWIAYRVHWETSRWAAFVEDTTTPVRDARSPVALHSSRSGSAVSGGARALGISQRAVLGPARFWPALASTVAGNA